MIVTQTPLRVSIAGGGTDLPSYYRRFGGSWVSAAIERHVHVAVDPRALGGRYSIRCPELEEVDSPAAITHRGVREVLRRHPLGPGAQVVSFSDVPAGTGLGSSGSFLVGLLHAVRLARGLAVAPEVLAEEACAIEMDALGEPSGKQDPYIAAFGGITAFEVATDGAVRAAPLALPERARSELAERLLLFFTGRTRRSTALLQEQRARCEEDAPAMLEALHQTAALGRRLRAALEAGDTLAFAEGMHEHWLRKRARSRGISDGAIDAWYDLGRAHGALGGKLVGAGGGGFLLFYARDPAGVRAAMAGAGLAELPFSFSPGGTRVVVRS